MDTYFYEKFGPLYHETGTRVCVHFADDSTFETIAEHFSQIPVLLELFGEVRVPFDMPKSKVEWYTIYDYLGADDEFAMKLGLTMSLSDKIELGKMQGKLKDTFYSKVGPYAGMKIHTLPNNVWDTFDTTLLAVDILCPQVSDLGMIAKKIKTQPEKDMRKSLLRLYACVIRYNINSNGLCEQLAKDKIIYYSRLIYGMIDLSGLPVSALVSGLFKGNLYDTKRPYNSVVVMELVRYKSIVIPYDVNCPISTIDIVLQYSNDVKIEGLRSKKISPSLYQRLLYIPKN